MEGVCDIQQLTSKVQGNREKIGRQPRSTGEKIAFFGRAEEMVEHFHSVDTAKFVLLIVFTLTQRSPE